jgi:hypothetical protein
VARVTPPGNRAFTSVKNPENEGGIAFEEEESMKELHYARLMLMATPIVAVELWGIRKGSRPGFGLVAVCTILS